MLLTQPFSVKVPFSENFARERRDQYNAYVVDALLSGQVHLLIEPPNELLDLQNPYDPAVRTTAAVVFPFDHVFYNGKYYSYFGIVQVLVLALPYKLITGNYIPTRVAVFIFSALASIFLMLIWRRLVFRFMKDMPLGMYALGQLAVAMCSMITFEVNNPRFYEVAASSAMFFTAFGLWIILGSIWKEKLNLISLAVGCLCMALAVGCRPNSLFVSFLVPVLLFEGARKTWRNKRQFAGLCACVAMPYILVAGGLMWYNYIRFGSVFEFGANYQLTGANIKACHLLNPMGKLLKILSGSLSYLFSPFGIRASFPFTYLVELDIRLLFKGYIYTSPAPALGILALPLTWPLLCIGKIKKIVDEKRRHVFCLIAAMITHGIFQMTFISYWFGIAARYELDFFWLFVFPGLICAYFMYEKLSVNLRGAALKIISVFVLFSIILIFLITLSSGQDNKIWNSNPDIYYYIQRLFGFNTW
jgi:hypothetical protein